MFWDESRVELTFNWLHGEDAKAIAAICKQNNATKVQRVAQERGALGYCKLIVTFGQHPGWYTNHQSSLAAKAAVEAAGLTKNALRTVDYNTKY